MNVLLDLAERCEKAVGPDRELDALIRAELEGRDVTWDGNRALGRSRVPPYETCLIGTIDPGKYQRNFAIAWSKPECPEYTGSIDAAMLLLAAGGEITISNLYGIARVSYPLNGGDVTPFYGEHAGGLLPLAICAAALRDKAHSLTSQPRGSEAE